MGNPLVSIIIPTYNRLPLLREAIDSVARQTLSDWELIIVDDGSSDGTVDFVRSLRDPRVQLIEGQHSGFAGAVRNKGIARARGQYIAFLDSDDRWAPNKLQVQLDDLRQKPWAQWSYTYTDFMDERGRGKQMPRPRNTPTRKAYEGWILHALLDHTAWIALPTVVVERSVVDGLRGFNERIRMGHDSELWLRLARVAQAAVVTESLATIRLHAGRLWGTNSVEGFEWGVEIHRLLLREELPAADRAAALRAHSRAFTRLADAYKANGRYLAAMTALIRALPLGASRFEWWDSLARTLVRPFAFWKRRQNLNQRGTIVAPSNSPP